MPTIYMVIVDDSWDEGRRDLAVAFTDQAEANAAAEKIRGVLDRTRYPGSDIPTVYVFPDDTDKSSERVSEYLADVLQFA